MKLALIYSFKDSDWFSCTVILKNLLKSYEAAFGSENLLRINYSNEDGVRKEDISEMLTQEVDKIVFLDHQPSPLKFLKLMNSIEKQKKSKEREFIFHIYGDFPLFLVDWYKISEIVTGDKVKFICASEKQKNYISRYFHVDKNIYTCPFPVDPKQFFVDGSKRKKIRDSFKLTDDDNLFIYVGRLSYQKRIIDMVEQFIIALDKKSLSKNSKLLIIGPFDKLKLFYLGDFGVEGEYFREIERLLDKYPNYRDNIVFTGHLDHEELKDYYNASDCFFSLSTYHDEDYGMAVAEAICTGLPTILTDWAGYSSFRVEDNLEASHYVKVELADVLPTIDFSTLQEQIKSFTSKTYDRELNAKKAQNKFSIDANSLIINSIYNDDANEFRGATDLLVYLKSQAIMKHHELFKFETEKKYNQFYYEVYNAYTE